MVDTVALKATFLRSIGSSPIVGSGGYSLMVKCWIVDSKLWVQFPVAAHVKDRTPLFSTSEGRWPSG